MALRVVCLNVGEKYSDLYVQRLANMVGRNLSVPHQFVCFTDRARDLTSNIEQRDAASWTTHGWFSKLKLFDRAVLDQQFLFLDLALVVRRSLDPLAARANETDADLIAMRDWNYDCLGSMLMWVRPSDATQRIWDKFASGVRYPFQTNVDGDQDFIDAAIRDLSIEDRVSYFPQEWFVSFKALRKLYLKDRARCFSDLERSLIVKFHGPPKMHEMEDPRRYARILWRQTSFRAPLVWPFFQRELRELWR